jgi:hypothetical protein
MSASNQRKAATLGMPQGTANNRLRKIILFHLLKRLGENYCFKCNELIEVVEDLSIEHKKPWEGISAELYWDLENIAFSHLRCNRPDRPNGGTRTIIVPKGTIWCGACKQPRAEQLFTPGAKNECSPCKATRNAQRVRRVQSDVGIVVERHLAKV